MFSGIQSLRIVMGLGPLVERRHELVFSHLGPKAKLLLHRVDDAVNLCRLNGLGVLLPKVLRTEVVLNHLVKLCRFLYALLCPLGDVLIAEQSHTGAMPERVLLLCVHAASRLKP